MERRGKKRRMERLMRKSKTTIRRKRNINVDKRERMKEENNKSAIAKNMKKGIIHT